MSYTENFNRIFQQAICDYHVKNDIDMEINNPYSRDSLENRLYLKCWIDTVQWHLEDIIRDPHIDPIDALQLKRRIDRSNQDRTDLVEQIDSYFRQKYCDVNVLPDARFNMGNRPPLYSGTENLSHAGRGGTTGCYGRTS